MEAYKNLGGNSAVIAYDMGPDWITVEFFDGAMYRYTYASAGARHVEEMKRLAVAGRGLNGYINQVGAKYAEKRGM